VETEWSRWQQHMRGRYSDLLCKIEEYLT
jgi:hypothetical protein